MKRSILQFGKNNILRFIKNRNKPSIINQIGILNQKNREEWLQKTLNSIEKGKRILDAGAGELQYKKYCSHLQYVSQDFNQYDGKGDMQGLQTEKWDTSHIDIVSDITDIPEPDNSFDAIMCIEVFEHLPNPILAVKEFSRLLKTKGILIITAPFCSLTHFAPFHYYTGFNRYFFETYLEKFGFKIQEISANGNFFEFVAQELRRIPSIAEEYSGIKVTQEFRNNINHVLSELDLINKHDKGSNELLNYGFHVYAQKI